MKSREYYHKLVDHILDACKIDDIEDVNTHRPMPKRMNLVYHPIYQGYEIMIDRKPKGLIGSNTPKEFELFRILMNHYLKSNGSEIKPLKKKETQ